MNQSNYHPSMRGWFAGELYNQMANNDNYKIDQRLETLKTAQGFYS